MTEMTVDMEALATQLAQRVDPVIAAAAIRAAEERLPQMQADISKKMDEKIGAMHQESLAEIRALGESRRPPGPGGLPAGPFESLGDQLRAIRRSAQPGGITDERLPQVLAATGMSEGVGADGGFLLQPQFIADIMRLTNETGVVWGRIPDNRKISISVGANSVEMPAIDETSRANGSRWGGMRAYWDAEAATMTATAPKFKRLRLQLDKLTALAYMTDEQLEDTPMIAAIVQDGFAEEFGFKLDDALIRGTGVGEPEGILVAAATVSVAKETSQPTATLVFENIVKMWSRLWARSRANAVWYINQDIEPQLYSLALNVGTGGVPVYLPANGLSGQPFGTLFGRPVVPIEQCATLGTVGDVILADMSQYWAATKGGPRFASSIHVQFLTNETAFRGVMRATARPMWLSALTPFQGTNTVSPFITLATRA